MGALPSRAATLPASFRSMTMAEGLRAAMLRTPDKIAVIHGAETRSYRDLVARIDRVANAALADLKLAPGETAAIVARNCIAYVEIVCGIPAAGVPVATVNPRLTAPEIAAICDDANARVIFTDSPALVAEAARGRRVIALGAAFEDWLATHGAVPLPRPAVEEWDTWTIPYTSGTTGKPKGVMISHRSRILTFYGKAVEYGCYGPDDRFLGITPMNHGAGISYSLAVLFFGGLLEIVDKYDAEAVLRKLKYGTREGPVTGIFMVPTHFHALFALPPAVLEECRGAPIKTIICNAAPLPQATKEQIVAYFGPGILHETYGSTEGGVVTNLRPADQLRKERCVGLPFPNTLVRLLDDQGREVGPGEVGELFSRSPYLFNGYWRRPQETADTFRDGWVSVGDLAKRDAEGFVYIVDRKKDMVISGGVNIYPREIEEVLFHHPAVAEVAVVGVPDDKWGETLKAVVVLKPGTRLTLQDLTAFCEGRLAAYKIPKTMAVIDALPRNAGGKVLKTALRD
jgi:long-chain acyl-CoA synthetase